MHIPTILSRASLLFQTTSAPKQAPSVDAEATRPKSMDGISVKVSQEAESLAKQSDAVNQSKVDELRQRFAVGAFNVDHLGLARAMLAQS